MLSSFFYKFSEIPIIAVPNIGVRNLMSNIKSSFTNALNHTLTEFNLEVELYKQDIDFRKYYTILFIYGK